MDFAFDLAPRATRYDDCFNNRSSHAVRSRWDQISNKSLRLEFASFRRA